MPQAAEAGHDAGGQIPQRVCADVQVLEPSQPAERGRQLAQAVVTQVEHAQRPSSPIRSGTTAIRFCDRLSDSSPVRSHTQPGTAVSPRVVEAEHTRAVAGIVQMQLHCDHLRTRFSNEFLLRLVRAGCALPLTMKLIVKRVLGAP